MNEHFFEHFISRGGEIMTSGFGFNCIAQTFFDGIERGGKLKASAFDLGRTEIARLTLSCLNFDALRNDLTILFPYTEEITPFALGTETEPGPRKLRISGNEQGIRVLASVSPRG